MQVTGKVTGEHKSFLCVGEGAGPTTFKGNFHNFCVQLDLGYSLYVRQ